MNEQLITIQNLSALKTWLTQDFLPTLQAGTLVLLSGEMGAGKTELVRQWMEIWQGEDVQSPSFSLQNVYHTKQGTLYHWDLYRLDSIDELESAGFWDQFSQDPSSVCAIIIEWPERVPEDWWPSLWRTIRINIEKKTGTERVLKLKT